MKLRLIICLLGIITASSAFADAEIPKTLCLQDEQVLFSCHLHHKGKMVSLCASKDFDSTKGYLQYRFGKAGNIEMQYPAQGQRLRNMFHYGHYFRYQVDRTRIYFNKGAYSYEVFSGYEGDVQQKVINKGVQVTKTTNANNEITYLCSKDILDKLSKLETILSCNSDEVDCPLGMSSPATGP